MKNKLPTIDIKGKKYVQVKDRILAFQELYPNGSIVTEKFVDGDIIVFKATVVPDMGITPKRMFTGHSEAIRGVSQGITGQSPIEVAETSAVGRALAMLGIGIIESVASADEVNKADGTFGKTYFRPDTMSAKPISPAQKKLIVNLEGARGKDVLDPKFLTELDSMNSYQASQRINTLKSDTNATAKAKLDFVEDLGDEPPVMNYDE